MRKKGLDIVSLLIVLIGLFILIVFVVNPIGSIEESLRYLSIAILYSVFLAGAIIHLIRKD